MVHKKFRHHESVQIVGEDVERVLTGGKKFFWGEAGGWREGYDLREKYLPLYEKREKRFIMCSFLE